MGQCTSGLGLIYTNLNAYEGALEPETPKMTILGAFWATFFPILGFLSPQCDLGGLWHSVGHCTSGLEPSWTNLHTLGGPGSPTTPQNSHFFQKFAQLPILRTSLYKDEMAWKQLSSVILMYIIGWRFGTFAAHTPMTNLKVIENDQNGHFGGF